MHFQQTLLLGLDTIKQRGVGELEPVVLSSLKSVVGLGLGHLSHKLLEVTTISAELEAVQVKNIRDRVVEETGVMRHDDCELDEH